MKIAVVGSRTIKTFDFALVGAVAGDTIITGGAVGVDSFAEAEARARGIAVEVIKPDYKTYGRAATHVRNRAIVERCDRLVAFWDGQSRGTMGTVEYARRKGKPIDLHE